MQCTLMLASRRLRLSLVKMSQYRQRTVSVTPDGERLLLGSRSSVRVPIDWQMGEYPMEFLALGLPSRLSPFP